MGECGCSIGKYADAVEECNKSPARLQRSTENPLERSCRRVRFFRLAHWEYQRHGPVSLPIFAHSANKTVVHYLTGKIHVESLKLTALAFDLE